MMYRLIAWVDRPENREFVCCLWGAFTLLALEVIAFLLYKSVTA